MANATYDSLWSQAISELGEQLHVEGADDGDDELNLGDTREVRELNPSHVVHVFFFTIFIVATQLLITINRNLKTLLSIKLFNTLLVYISSIYKSSDSWRNVMIA